MEVQCLKVWDRVTDEKLQNASSFVKLLHLQFGNDYEFYHLLLFYSSKSLRMFNIILKIVKLSLKWYVNCYDYILYGSTVLWKMKESKIGKLTSDSRLNRPAENKWHNAIQ